MNIDSKGLNCVVSDTCGDISANRLTQKERAVSLGWRAFDEGDPGLLPRGCESFINAPVMRAAHGKDEQNVQDSRSGMKTLVDESEVDLQVIGEDAEGMVLEILEKVVMLDPEVKSAVKTWGAQVLEDQKNGKPLTVHEHVALTYILKSGFFNDKPAKGQQVDSDASFNALMRLEFQTSLAASWKKLTGKDRNPKKLLTRLPRRVLLRAEHEVRIFHAAAFQSKSPRKAKAKLALGKDYIPMPQDIVVAIGILSAAFTAVGASLIVGVLIGYLVVTLAESYFHKKFGHASGKFAKWCDEKGWFIGQWILKAAFSHTKIHHSATFTKDHVTQFESPEQKAELDTELEKLGKLGKNIMAEDYGVTLSAEGVLWFVAPVVPVFAGLIAGVLALKLSPLFIVGMLIPAILYPCSSKYMHPYIHMSKKQAMEKAGPLMRMFLKTRYTKMVSRTHYGHHKGRGGNFNLIWGGDAMLGVLRKPNLKQLFEMRNLKMIY